MEMLGILAAFFFIFGYLLITMERKFSTNKSAIALTLGGVLWVLAGLKLRGDEDGLKQSLAHTGTDVFGIVAFLLAAMALIEILVHYRLFDLIRAKLIRMNVRDRAQFLIIIGITFFLSAVLDNIAITIAMLQIARRFFVGRNMIIGAAGIVVAANAGGAWSPIGDITTVLLWLGGMFTVAEVVRYAFLPSLVLCVVVTALLYRKISNSGVDKREEGDLVRLTRSEKLGYSFGAGQLQLSASDELYRPAAIHWTAIWAGADMDCY